MADSFSISSTRVFLDSGMLFIRGMETWWNNRVPIKVNIFVWRLRLFSTPTRERLSYMGIEAEMIMCSVCSYSVKTVDHLFIGCSELIQLWIRIAIWWGLHLPDLISIHSLISWPDSIMLTGGQMKAFEVVLWTSF